LRLADLHGRTDRPVQHPRRHDDRHAWLILNDNYVGTSTLLYIIASEPAPMERMPAVVDLYLFSDMGRMTQ
jgi:hypothetical protein